MSGPVRNFCVARGHLVTNELLSVFTVPPDHSFILKSIHVFAGTAAAVPTSGYLSAADNSAGVWFLSENTGANGILASELWLVMNAGDWLGLYCEGNAPTYWITGALLPYAGAIPPIASTRSAPPTTPPHPNPGPKPQQIRIIP